MTENDITNSIWRKWAEQKITPPMTWQQLWDAVRYCLTLGLTNVDDIYELITPLETYTGDKVEEARKRAQEAVSHLKGVLKPKAEMRYGREKTLPWPNPEPEAIVEEAELKTFAEWLLAAVKRVWKTKKPESFWEWLIEPTDRGVLVGLRGVSRPHELFSASLIEKHNPDKLKDLFAGRTLEGYVEAAKVRTLETFKGVTFYFETREDRQRAYELLARHDFHFPYGPDFSLTGIDNPDHMLEILASEGFDTARILVERI